ncbi:MAG: arsenate reductase [Lautropia sp.]
MAVTIYGISNCDQVRKTLAWLRENRVEHRLHDYRQDGIDRSMLERWCTHLPWNSLLNRRGLTWRSLPDAARAQVVDQTSAIELMLAHPTLIKRPVIEFEDRLQLGFSAERLAAAMFPAEVQGPRS